MRVHQVLLALSTLVSSALSSKCPGSGPGTAAPGAPYWMQSIKHQGIAPYNDASSYPVFRNVKDYGAVGDGKTDDTAAINLAISTGPGRCGQGKCPSSTTAPAVVYFPAGTYLVSSPIVPWYYTQLIGDARTPPTLVASSTFSGSVIDADPYLGDNIQWYTNQNNFYRSIRNLVIDLRGAPASGVTGIHWQVSQSTSLMNIVVEMGEGTQHQGMFMENGSGGFMGDLIFNGGKIGMWLGNQQFTVRNVTVNNAATGIFAAWNWGWTYQGITINNAQVGFDVLNGGTVGTVGGIALIDIVINNTPIGIRTSHSSNGTLHGSMVLNNVKLNNVPNAIAVTDGTIVLAGSTGTSTIESWGMGNVYSGKSSQGQFVQGNLPAVHKDASLLDSAGRIFGRGHPQYADYDVSQFVSARSAGAKGDGVTDDTAALQALFRSAAKCQIVFLDAGVYYITNTLKIPVGTRVVGEAWSVIMAGGPAFNDQANPKVAVQIGSAGDKGVMEISDVIFTTQAPAADAIVVEWNVAGDAPGNAGTWDTHIRIGGTAGTNTDLVQCPAGNQNFASCTAAFLSLHLTSSSSAYLEGLWSWYSDHYAEDPSQNQTSVFGGRGILSESKGPVWMIGTAAEHAGIYQYSLVNAKNHYMGLIQTETPYYQPMVSLNPPFLAHSSFHDPSPLPKMAWGLNVKSSSNIFVFGAGHYAFFQNYNGTCVSTDTCQPEIVNIDKASSIAIYQLATVGVTNELSINQQAILPSAPNYEGTQSSITLWTSS